MKNDEHDADRMELISEPDEEGVEQERPASVDAPPVKKELPLVELPRIDPKTANAWKPKSGGCMAIGFAVGVIVLAGLFMFTFSSLKQTVWVSFDQSCELATSALPFDMSPERRTQFRDDVTAFAKKVRSMEDPYPTMGSFTGEVAGALRDGSLSVRDVEKIEAILDATLRGQPRSEP